MAPAIQLCLVQSHIASWSPSIYISRVLVCLSLGGSWSWRVPRPVSHFPCFLAPGFQVPAHCLMRLLFSMQRADTLSKHLLQCQGRSIFLSGVRDFAVPWIASCSMQDICHHSSKAILPQSASHSKHTTATQATPHSVQHHLAGCFSDDRSK